MKVLVTGGVGFIGSHVCIELIHAGHAPLLLDNLSNGHCRVVDQIERICGSKPALIVGDVRDSQLLDKIFSGEEINAVMHFAGRKAVGESVSYPMDYYSNNVGGAVELLRAMKKARVEAFVFSSSATVYGDSQQMPLREDAARAATSPYGRSKLFVEDILSDLASAVPGWRIACLRYFNPVGAHASGQIGEDPKGTPNNLMPYLAQVAIGRRPQLDVYGDDYPTSDGTGVRDYIHVCDLAQGHVAALEYLSKNEGLITVNLGTGRGYSVLDMIAAFERVCGRSIPFRIAPRRPGDVAECYADPGLAQKLLNWRAAKSIDQMCADTWRWQCSYPNGLN